MTNPTSSSLLYNSDSVWLPVALTSVAATTSHWVIAPGNGIIRRMKVVVAGAVSDDTTFGLELTGTNVTDGGSAAIVTVAASGSGAGTVAVGEADAANTVSEGDAVEVTCGGEGSVASAGLALIEFCPA